jgi:5-hydroxyisourate hydrolase
MGISTHILDTALGRPAVDVAVALTFWKDSDWVLVNGANTDQDGRIKHLLPLGDPLYPGLYRVRFYTAAYFEALGVPGLYPYIDVVLQVKLNEPHLHIPLLLTANSYTTYRGS